MRTSKKEIITSLVDQARSFRFCGPSDDPDEQTAVTFGFRHLVIQFKRLVGPILPEVAASRLDAIDVGATISTLPMRQKQNSTLFYLTSKMFSNNSTIPGFP